MESNSNIESRTDLSERLFDMLHDWYDDANQSRDEKALVETSQEKSVQSGKAREIAARSNMGEMSFRDLARSVYQARRLRDKIFSCAEIFGEPAWDMLLDIATAESENSRLSVTAVCIGSCVAPTTALRYVKALEERDLIHREEDLSDGRRQYIRLTPKGDRLLRRYFYQTFGPNNEGPLKDDAAKYIEQG